MILLSILTSIFLNLGLLIRLRVRQLIHFTKNLDLLSKPIIIARV
jgi:hypothetical protein